MSTTLNLAEVRTPLNRTIDAIEGVLGDVVALDGSMYWRIDSVDAFRISTEPTANVGSLADDVERPRATNAGSREAKVSPWHD